MKMRFLQDNNRYQLFHFIKFVGGDVTEGSGGNIFSLFLLFKIHFFQWFWVIFCYRHKSSG